MSKSNTLPTTRLFSIDFYNGSLESLKNVLKEHLEHDKKLWLIATPNPEQVVQMKTEPILQEVFDEADICIPDGMGIVWASRLLDVQPKISARISGREVAEEVLEIAGGAKLKVLVVGGRGYLEHPSFALRASKGKQVSGVRFQEVEKWENEMSTLKIKPPTSPMLPGAGQSPITVGWLEGYENVNQPTVEEESAVVKTIQTLQPDIVFVAFGAPAQERWMLEHRELLEKSRVKIVMVVGGAFDYLLGKTPQVPRLIVQLGLEWLFRLITQPWRWRRQLRLVTFIVLVLKHKLIKVI